jgi:exosortase H (IPTLxxWG-CTERM-specific)
MVYTLILAVSFTAVAWQPVNRGLVEPFTAAVARVSGAVLGLLGEDPTVRGCDITTPRFSVTIYNGCNGLITSLVFAAGVLAFPARWWMRGVGLLLGLMAIQVVNLVRILSLYYIGVFFPAAFDQAHVVVWQGLVIVFGVALWIAWARWATRAGS